MKLVYPNKKYYKSYKEADKEYKENNVDTYFFDDIEQIDVAKKYYNYRNGINLKPDRVPQTTYWLIDNNEFIGEVSLRHYLNDKLLEYGGHISYGVRYSKWNKGYGTKMLSLILKKAKLMGMDKVLITCNYDNYGSARIIEKNGGKLENEIEVIVGSVPVKIKRYWITL